MACELCGKREQQYTAIVEGSPVKVCDVCSKYGRVTGKVKVAEVASKKSAAQKEAIPERTETVVSSIGSVLKEKRERYKQTHEEFAGKIGIKTSILHKIETGHFIPDIATARRIEKILSIKLVEITEVKEEHAPVYKNDDGMTIGDFIKTRKK